MMISIAPRAPDEYVTIADLNVVFRVHAFTAFDYLSAKRRAA